MPTSFTSCGSHAVRARAQAGRHGARRAGPLVDASRVRGRPVRGARRHELLRAARLGRRRAPRPASSVVDAAADEVGAHVDRGPAWADTSLTQEASVLVEGAGLVQRRHRRPAARSSPIRSRSRSATSLRAGARTRKSISVVVSDAGDGAGTWIAEVQPQVASAGATVEAAPVTLAPGGTAVMQITARASAGAVQGDNFGFVVLRRGSDVRRIPYAFSVSRSSLTGAPVTALKTTAVGRHAQPARIARSVYRWPTSPFSILGIFGVDPSVNDDGKEKIYSLDITKQAVNAGVVVVTPAPKLDAPITALLSSNQPIHPWFMGSLDENDVLGYAGIPVNVNGELPDFLYSIGAAGGVFLPPGRYYVSVDSGRDLFTRALARGQVHAALVGQRRQAADGHGSSRRRSRAAGRPSSRRSPTRSPASTRTPSSSSSGRRRAERRSARRSSTRRPGLRRSRYRASALPARRRARSSCSSSRPTSRRRRTSTRSPAARSRTRASRGSAPRRCRDRPSRGSRPRRARCVAARQKLLVVANDNVQISSVGFFDGKRQIGRVQQERRRALRADLADERQAQGRARAHGRRVGRPRARGRGEPDRPRSASDRGDAVREAASRRRHDRRRRGGEPVRQPLRRPPRRRVVGGSRLHGQARRRSLGPRRLRRR